MGPDCIRRITFENSTNRVYFSLFRIWVNFPSGFPGHREVVVLEKMAPKRNTVHQNALYGHQIVARLAIGVRCAVGLPSETLFTDVDGGGGAGGIFSGYGHHTFEGSGADFFLKKIPDGGRVYSFFFEIIFKTFSGFFQKNFTKKFDRDHFRDLDVLHGSLESPHTLVIAALLQTLERKRDCHPG